MAILAFDPPAPFAAESEWRRFRRDIESLIERSSQENAADLRRMLDNALQSHEQSSEFGQ